DLVRLSVAFTEAMCVWAIDTCLTTKAPISQSTAANRFRNGRPEVILFISCWEPYPRKAFVPFDGQLAWQSDDMSAHYTKYRGCRGLSDVGPSHPFRQAFVRKSVNVSS